MASTSGQRSSSAMTPHGVQSSKGKQEKSRPRVGPNGPDFFYPFLYRSMFTLLVGPHKEPFLVHKQLLEKKSALVAEHTKQLELREVKIPYLNKTLDEFQGLPKAVHCPVNRARTGQHPNCQIVCAISKTFINDIPRALINTDADVLPPLFNLLSMPYARHDSRLSHSRMLHLKLWELEANNDHETMNKLVQRGIDHAAKQLIHEKCVKVIGLGSLELPNAEPVVVEIFVHALYSGSIRAMKMDGEWRSPTWVELVKLQAFARVMGVTSFNPELIVQAHRSLDRKNHKSEVKDMLAKVWELDKQENKLMFLCLDRMKEIEEAEEARNEPEKNNRDQLFEEIQEQLYSMSLQVRTQEQRHDIERDHKELEKMKRDLVQLTMQTEQRKLELKAREQTLDNKQRELESMQEEKGEGGEQKQEEVEQEPRKHEQTSEESEDGSLVSTPSSPTSLVVVD